MTDEEDYELLESVAAPTVERSVEDQWATGVDVALDGTFGLPCGCVGQEIVCEQHRQVRPRRRY